MPLFLVRHGETEFNVAGRFQGQNDSALTDKGIQQARANASAIAQQITDVDAVHFVSSPLGRTLATSRLICDVIGIPFERVKTDDRLKEMHFGAWQGMTELEINQEYPGQWDLHHAGPDDFAIPGGGESYLNLTRRVDDWIGDTRTEWESNKVWIAVSHGCTGSVIRGRYSGLNTEKLRLLARPHACVYEFRDATIAEHITDEAQLP